MMRSGFAFGQQDQRELVAGEPRQRVLRLQQPAEPAREREQDRVADRDADRIVDLLEAVEIDHDHGRPDRRVGLGEGEHRLEPVEEQLAVRQAGQVVVDRIVQQPLLRVLELGDVGERADEPHHLAVGADHRPRLEREPEIMAVRRAQPEILGQPAAPLLEHAVERGAEAVAVERMQHVEPARGRAFERAALEAEQRSVSGLVIDLVGGDVPVPDHVAGAGQRERAALDVGDDAAWSTPPAKACCITVKPISITISTRPPSSAGPTMSLVTMPVTASAAATTQTTSRSQVGISSTARSKPWNER